MTEAGIAIDLTPSAPKRRVRLPYMAVALALLVVLLIANTVLEPRIWSIDVLTGLIAAAAPLIFAAVAQTVLILLGNGALDISIGPLISLINVSIVLLAGNGVTSPLALIGCALLIGIVSGLINGSLVSFLRLQSIVVTFGTFSIYSGLATFLLPQPGGSVPDWLIGWTGNIGPIPMCVLFIAGGLAFWWLLSRTRFMKNIYAIGGDERASYVSAVPIAWVKLGAFVLTGIFTAFAALLLTSTVASGDGNIGNSFTLTSLAAVALGGTSLLGGRGGVWGTLIGAVAIFLVDNLITVSHIGVFWQQIAYGIILVGAIIINAVLGRSRR
ncbi:ABC transporter permease [Paenibacillus sp. sptzw28]|uniref:ABC transporter permease n=1 Tax=Paenibacillus sp. sptzw28 TaxID=715179 RepID=UPI001C6EA8F2|nr:ABC transporter permease [Paenibacillus sp. sptzw28]QYR21799.1 ABC transporter permease [Paenibacillus sp. sptzw28]